MQRFATQKVKHLLRGATAARVACLVLAGLASASVYAAVPANDNFANAIVITNLPFVYSEFNECATAEPGEPNHLGVGAVISRLDRDHRVLGEGILPDRQLLKRFHADDQNHQADHNRQNRPGDEKIGEFHSCTGRGAGSFDTAIELLIVTGNPGLSLTAPATTT